MATHSLFFIYLDKMMMMTLQARIKAKPILTQSYPSSYNKHNSNASSTGPLRMIPGSVPLVSAPVTQDQPSGATSSSDHIQSIPGFMSLNVNNGGVPPPELLNNSGVAGSKSQHQLVNYVNTSDAHNHHVMQHPHQGSAPSSTSSSSPYAAGSNSNLTTGSNGVYVVTNHNANPQASHPVVNQSPAAVFVNHQQQRIYTPNHHQQQMNLHNNYPNGQISGQMMNPVSVSSGQITFPNSHLPTLNPQQVSLHILYKLSSEWVSCFICFM